MSDPVTLSQAHNSSADQAVRLDELVSLELIRKLVSFDTTSRESNLSLIEWVRGYLAGHGIASMLTFDDTARKANLFATLPTRDGDSTRGGIVLSSHTDVVPVDGQPWDTDPFNVVITDGKLYGRGVADMKSFIAAGLALVPELLQRGLRRPVHFALSYDEEVGCLGVHRLIADILARGITPAGCIVGEPTGMELVVAHKGKQSWRCRVRGLEAHSALTPRGVNAVHIAAEIVAYITRRAREFRNGKQQDHSYDVPYTTVHVGSIRGGTALNIVPRDCTFDFEMRHLPFDNPDAFFSEVLTFANQFLPEMHAVSATTHIEFDVLSTQPGFETEDTNEIAALGRACNHTHDAHKVSFGTEASLYHKAGIPAVVCGPGHITQAHQPNEWVTIDQIARCEQFMRRLGDHVCA